MKKINVLYEEKVVMNSFVNKTWCNLIDGVVGLVSNSGGDR